ncbi:helix-turn-helix transcriptional regulator [Aneurinibacillus aneurinilyticus]|uniref:helix-turn-helix domain-containing protein n=1 Tax=Aneurinibacillus aneurinilyticus TaxID=1391 RepID=UPI002E23F497|nr:helix-turn-helix transcriptional regulator [Aneurinibacillus aneurinilyticus]MED0726511.1 helix-turn-helix transcriptional regulator [Aneurinibacillus aneurinilyticus]
MLQLGRAIRKVRNKRKLSQNALGKLVGVDASYINKIENNKAPGSLLTIKKIAEALNCTLTELMALAESTESEEEIMVS